MKIDLKKIARLASGTMAFHLLKGEVWALPVMPLAQIPPALKTSFQGGLGVLFLAGFIWGVIKIWGGADRMSKGDADGKMGIVSGIIIAGAAAIMGALFSIFGMTDGALVPSF